MRTWCPLRNQSRSNAYSYRVLLPLLLLLCLSVYYTAECCCCSCCCCSSSCARRPFFCWFFESDPTRCFFSLHSNAISFDGTPFGSTAASSHLRPILAYILGNHGHARSQGKHQPATAEPPFFFFSNLPSMWYLLRYLRPFPPVVNSCCTQKS